LVSQNDVEVKTVTKNLQKLYDNGTIEPTGLEKLRTRLQEIKETLGIYTVTKEVDLSADPPTYLLSFTLMPLNLTLDDPNIVTPHPSDSNWSSHLINTSYKVDLLASDGDNVFYTSYCDHDPDLIAYCYLDSTDEPDPHRNWNQSRIIDVVWWDRINSFICATREAVYTVTFQKDEFKILAQVRGEWSYVRVATNSDELWLWVNNTRDDFDGIWIYDDDFELVREIDFGDGCHRPFVHNSTSFCITDTLTASICERRVMGDHLFQVNFNGFNFMNFKTVYVDKTYNGTMIRTDGENQFFMTTGGRKLYMVSPNMVIKHLILENDSDALTFVNSRCFVVSCGTRDIEIWTISPKNVEGKNVEDKMSK
jgi:hypothetical protein